METEIQECGFVESKAGKKQGYYWPKGLPKSWQWLDTEEQRDQYRLHSRRRAYHTKGVCICNGTESTSTSEVTAAFLEEMFHSQSGKCHYSGDDLTIENMALEHMLPLSRGGQHAIENVVWSTKRVNRMKGTMTAEEFVEKCEEIACNCAQKKRD